ncbi:lactonase family protein [Catelliglobosispora koreensis]|uniref:lactonase family protein n=1 Tax=Catelliglobosispora koreensis TaxID=129052 RepID=UPI00038065E5|nr:lactonase family protein [Catelliglobosispora koreensis]
MGNIKADGGGVERSADVALIYVGSYGSGIRCFRQNLDTGELTVAHPPLDVADPSFLAWHPSGAYLYAVCERDPGRIAAVAVAEDGSLTLLNTEPTGGTSPCHLAIDAEGEFAVVANYSSGSVSVHPVRAGQVGARTDLVQHTGTGPNAERQEGPHAHMVSFTKYPRMVLVTDLGTDQIMTYRLEPEGTLTQMGSAAMTPGSGPRHMAHHESGRLYIDGELDTMVDICEVRASGAMIRSVERHSAMVGEVPSGNLPSHLELHGKHLYVANRGANCISVFETDPWRPVIDVPTGGDWPRHFAIANGFMYVANQNSGDIAVSRLDGGVPGGFQFAAEVPGASCVLPVQSS